MNQHFRILRDTEIGEHLQRAFRTVHTLGTTVNNGANLLIPGLIYKTLNLATYLRVRHHDDIRNPRIVFERLNTPAHHRLVGDGDQLLGVTHIETGAETRGKHDRNHGDRGRTGGVGFRLGSGGLSLLDRLLSVPGFLALFTHTPHRKRNHARMS